MTQGEDPVQGCRFQSLDDDNRRNDTICRIIRRADVSDVEAREFGAAFVVEFGDSVRENVLATELSPWYPV